MVGITVSLEMLCSFLAPILSVFTIVVTFEFGRLLKDDTCALVAAALVAMVPALVRPTSAGLFDSCNLLFRFLLLFERVFKFCVFLSTHRFYHAASVGITLSLTASYLYAISLRDPARIFGYVSCNAIEAAVAARFARYVWPTASWLPVAAAFHAAILLGAKYIHMLVNSSDFLISQICCFRRADHDAHSVFSSYVITLIIFNGVSDFKFCFLSLFLSLSS